MKGKIAMLVLLTPLSAQAFTIQEAPAKKHGQCLELDNRIRDIVENKICGEGGCVKGIKITVNAHELKVKWTMKFN